MLRDDRLCVFGARQNMIAEDFRGDFDNPASNFEVIIEGLIQMALAAAEDEEDPGTRVSLLVSVEYLENAIDALDNDYL